MEEVWERVVGFDDRYMVSSLGRLQSIDRIVTTIKGVKKRLKGRVLKQTNHPQGYLLINFGKINKDVPCRVHRLVALAFIPNPDNKPCVNHIDSNRHNNNITNLEWCTYSENGKHAFLNGRNKQVHGEANVLSKHTEEFVLKIRSMKGMYTQYEIARLMGTNQGTVSDILLRKTWKHI